MENISAISIDNLSVRLGGRFRALKRVSLELSAGEIIGFIGPSGAGKTTLMRVLVGRQKITRGRAVMLGLPVGSAKLRGQFGYMTQNLSVYLDLTVRENLQYFTVMAGQSRRAARRSVDELLRQVNLAGHADQVVAELSGGEKQRVSLAVSLIGRPKILVLDEPTVGLDPMLREQLWDMFYKMRDAGTTIIISSHVMDEAHRCQDLVLIREGVVIAHAAPDDLCAQTGTENVEEAFIKLVEDKS